MNALVADCQTSGATPAQGQIIEIAWCVLKPTQSTTIQERLVRLEEGQTLLPRVKKITGISMEELENAPGSQTVWQLFDAALHREKVDCLVVHYAQFEQRFLRYWYQCFAQSELPLPIICTYEVARRIPIALPKLSLRALAGYYGHATPECRRSADHVRATARIWQALLGELSESHGISRFEPLLEWLKHPPPPKGRVLFPLPRERRRSAPDTPGTYRFLNRRGDVLYVGKATSLKHRVASYFHHPRNKAPHIREMLAQAADLEFTETASPLEAAMAEIQAIQQLNPPYNRSLRLIDPAVYYLSTDFGQSTSEPDVIHPLGPFPDKTPFEMIVLLIELSRTTEHKIDPASLPAPLTDCSTATISQGVALLDQMLFEQGLSQKSPLDLLCLGWIMAQQEPPEVTEDEDDAAPSSPKESFIWTPERIARLFCHWMRHAARLWYRAIWFGWLRESSVSWRPTATAETSERRWLWVSGGNICWGSQPPSSDKTTEWVKGTNEPKPITSRTTYDQLRVLTSELRRVWGKNHSVTVLLRGDQKIEPEQLATFLEHG